MGVFMLCLVTENNCQSILSLKNAIKNKNLAEAEKDIEILEKNLDIEKISDVYDFALAIDSLSNSLPNYLPRAIKYYQSLLTIASPESAFHTSSKTRLNGIWKANLYSGINAYNDSQYDQAINNFEIAQLAFPSDTTAYLYAAITSQEKGDCTKTASNLEKLMEYGKPSIQYYNTIVSCYFENKLFDRYEKTLSQANLIFPEELNLREQLLRSYLSNNKLNELEKMFVNLKNPTAEECSIMGEMHVVQYRRIHNQSNYESAKKYYLMGISKNNSNISSNYGYATLLIEKANELFEEVNKMNEVEYKESGNNLKLQGENILKEAAEKLETCFSVSPEETIIKNTLIQVHNILGNERRVKELSQ